MHPFSKLKKWNCFKRVLYTQKTSIESKWPSQSGTGFVTYKYVALLFLVHFLFSRLVMFDNKNKTI